MSNRHSDYITTVMRAGNALLNQLSQERRKGRELSLEVLAVPRKARDEPEVLEIETGSYAAAHQGKISQATGRLPEPLPDHRNALVIISRLSEHVAYERACVRIVAEQLEC